MGGAHVLLLFEVSTMHENAVRIIICVLKNDVRGRPEPLQDKVR